MGPDRGGIGTFVPDGRAQVPVALWPNHDTVEVMTTTWPSPTDNQNIVLLPGGRQGLVRPIDPEDAGALLRFHRQLSARSVRYRYFYPHMDLRESEVTHLTQVDGSDRCALVVALDHDLIAVARYDRLDQPTKAEVAFVVADTFQHLGLATLLLQRLAERARAVGITQFVADVLAENTAMLAVFHASGFPITSSCERGTVCLTMTIAAEPVLTSGS
jgi:RimJ/RimL family protein N-acetyltransferase